MQETYIFDFDGTLVDSMTPAVKMLLGFLDERGIVYPDDIVNTIIPLGFRGICEYYVHTFGVKETPEEIFAWIIEKLQGLYADEVQPIRGVEKTIRELKSRGASMSILTASPHDFLDPCVKRLGWEDLFDNLWSSEDFQLSKGEPYIFIEAAKRLGKQPNECIMVDDNKHALFAAKRAGLKTVAVYDSFSEQYADEIRSFVDFYANCVDEIL